MKTKLKSQTSGVPPEELYTRLDAEQALSYALKVYEIVSKLFTGVVSNNS